MSRPLLASRLRGFGTTIFSEMSALAEATGSVNLGQGFPDYDGPQEVLDAAVRAIRQGLNQYPPGPGVAPLREAIATHQRHWYGTEVDPATEVLVTAGATEAITAALLALCEPGDEVVVFEPTYDSYTAAISMAGAVPRFVPLSPDGDWDTADLARAVSARTRLILLNTPHNPTGKVFSAEELAAVADVASAAGVLVVTDEVYEHLVFDGSHVPMAGLPGMAERTLTVSSAGKTFSVTGWKVGWCVGPAALVAAVRTAKQFLTYVNAGPLQYAVAGGLGLPDATFLHQRDRLRDRRDQLVAGLEGMGAKVFNPAATYFATVDARSLGAEDGTEFCRQLPERCGVVAIPSQVFYQDAEAGRPYVRFAFCKRAEVIAEALVRLQDWGT
ncbi:MAG TPA: pyridoxal phosphate-dependent aminotransferase [Candidatus Acidoferrales bacterium]|nr:pyridoxal phosphate-dependent aminotransferase [Candidatus Acidoferrales bacterium]